MAWRGHSAGPGSAGACRPGPWTGAGQRRAPWRAVPDVLSPGASAWRRSGRGWPSPGPWCRRSPAGSRPAWRPLSGSRPRGSPGAGPEPRLAPALAPARQRGAVEGQLGLEELLAAEELELRVLEPALAQDLVREVVPVLHDGQACHQPRRQGRPAGAVLVDRPEPLLEEAPVDGTGEPPERVSGVDDRLEPGPEQIRRPGLAPLLGSQDSPRRDPDGSMESRPAALIHLPEKASPRRSTRQRRILAESKNSRPIRPLRILHGRLA